MNWHEIIFILLHESYYFAGLEASSCQECVKHLKSAAYITQRHQFQEGTNALVVNEKEKFNFSKFYDKDSVIVDISEVEAINAQVHTDNIMQAVAPIALTRGKIEEIVKKYDPKNKSGLGLVFIVESFDKTVAIADMEREALGTIDLVFFDIASGNVLMAKRMQGIATGFGLRNYWSRPVYEVMKQSKKNWNRWKKEAGLK